MINEQFEKLAEVNGCDFEVVEVPNKGITLILSNEDKIQPIWIPGAQKNMLDRSNLLIPVLDGEESVDISAVKIGMLGTLMIIDDSMVYMPGVFTVPGADGKVEIH